MLICTRAFTQQWQDGGVNRIIRESREVDAAVQTPVLDLLGGLSGRQLDQRPECFDLQKLVVGESFERAAAEKLEQLGINSTQMFIEATTNITFNEQAEIWLKECANRKKRSLEQPPSTPVDMRSTSGCIPSSGTSCSPIFTTRP